ncbi:disease resistance protein TAO1 isoform X1 [Prunus persica]|uniref:disease resistance protein TAO1 isoform X1 n=1 Tax=Prunus persica TaxID=3760 RepID=UPI0002C1D720|nr:disease resistance protein TAO1 isoform X1 [Prunus persica]
MLEVPSLLSFGGEDARKGFTGNLNTAFSDAGINASSSSSSSKSWMYQVFLSFRGEDIRKGFAGHLQAAFSDAGINAFLDDKELRRTEFIKTQLEQAIDGSMISIIVFSKGYADSSWCLDELVKIMECREKLGQKVIPLFYNVDASDVRKQTGSFAEAFEKHEAGICEGKLEREKVEQWRNALTQAADLCGEDLKNTYNGHEAELIKKIIGEVNKQLHSKYKLDIEHPVGITSRLWDLSDQLDIESGSKDVRMIGIWGMGGIGKTTLAKAIYNKFERSFEGRSFLANVREVIANQAINGLVGLQEKLLNDILKSKEAIKVGSVDLGITMIQERLRCKRALVIIDDVASIQQVKAIARDRDWFGPGSRIIITTRDQQLLEQVEVDSTYPAEQMDEEEAIELFSWHAFKRDYPDQEYLDLSKRVIHYCQGLPLALEVLGSFLNKRTTSEWESQLERLERSPHETITKILRISFDGLPSHTDRDIFLDISCFFIGMDLDYVTQILDGSGFSATLGIPILIERCLVDVSEENELMMHDLLREMGREIVREKSGRDDPKKFSRLWNHEDVTDVLRDESGTEAIEGLALDLQSSDKASFSAATFTNMKKLRLLHFNNVELTGEYNIFPKKLTWLCWHGFPLDSIPDDFPNQPKLVALDLQYSKLKIVWKDCKFLEKLKIINLSHSHCLMKSPDLSKLSCLKELILEDCTSLSEVHSSIGDLGRLSVVNLQDCNMLEDLPLNFYNSKSIETLLLNGCSRFENLADGLGDMISLKTLEADNTAIRQIPSSIVKLKNLEILSVCEVTRSPSTNLGLTEDAIPRDLWRLISLENLDLADNDFHSLPSLSGLSKLEILSLDDCLNLRAIPDLPTNLKVLKAAGCTGLEKMPDFSEMSNMRELYLSGSYKLTEIPGLDKSLNSMTRIHMESCMNLTADFRKNILQGWTSCGYGGIVLDGDDIPDWFDSVHENNILDFNVPQSVGRNFKGLTLSFVYSSDLDNEIPVVISITNLTQCTDFEAWITDIAEQYDCKLGNHYVWQGQLSNDELKLQDGNQVSIQIMPQDNCVKVKKTGVSLVWDKFMNENMTEYDLCGYQRRPSQKAGPSHDISDDIDLKNDNGITESEHFSELTYLEDCNNDFHKDLSCVISLTGLDLRGNDFHSLILGPGGFSNLQNLCLNDCIHLCAIPDLPTSLKVLKASGCTGLETMPDFSKMSYMRELYLNDSLKLTEIPGLDKSLNSMTRIHMEGCTNLTADFRKNILQGWSSCGYGGIFLNGIYDIPEWFELVDDVDNQVYFEVPAGRDLKGLTICFLYSSDYPELEDSQGPVRITVKNLTKQTALHARLAFASVKTSREPEDHYLWQGQLSNDVLRLQGRDKISILVRPLVDFVRVKKTGVYLEWDKLMKENMRNPDPHLYDLETNRIFSRGVADGAGWSRDTSVPTNQSNAVDEPLAVEGCLARLKSFLFNLFFNCFSFSHLR